MLFSVVIPTYNRLDFLKAALASVFAHTFTDYEVIVVDDGSNDGTREWLVTQSDRLRIVTQPNRGPGAARNAGAAAATGRFLVFLDSDDLMFPWTLAVYGQLLAAHGRPAFLAGKPLLFRGHETCAIAAPAPASAIAFDDYLASGDAWRWWGASSFVIDRDEFQRVRGFDEEPVNGEDGDLALKLGAAAGFIQVTRPDTFMYREHDHNMRKLLDRSVSGAWRKIASEKGGLYPGGNDRTRDRWIIITRHLRPIILACLRERRWRAAWGLYLATAFWNARLGRLRFVAGFPLLALYHCLRAIRIR